MTLSCKSVKEEIFFEVIDCGMGIPKNELENIFEPFYITDSAASLPGSGLGLSIVKDAA
ncbi:MAG: sensor histidine kinase [Bacteroidetes bacterium]|nr:sensor histidine kinase [Bacteroidota bacterium]